MKIGRKAKSIRRGKNISQAILAEKSGINQSIISQIENGKDCSEEQAQKIASALEISLFEIIDEEVMTLPAERTVQVGKHIDLNGEIDGTPKTYPVTVPTKHARVSVQWQKTAAIGEEWVGCRISVEMPCAIEDVESTKMRLVGQLKGEVELEIQKVLSEAFRTPDASLRMDA